MSNDLIEALERIWKEAHVSGKPDRGGMRRMPPDLREAIVAAHQALAAHRSQQEAPCQHRIADARNAVVQSGYACVDCAALFAAADHTKQQEAAQEPVMPLGYVRAGTIRRMQVGGEDCITLAMARTRCDLFTAALYTASPAPSESAANGGPTEQDLAERRAQVKLDELIRNGAILSNVAFNLRQRTGAVLSGQQCGFLEEAQRGWDEALREYRAAMAASGGESDAGPEGRS